MDFEPIRVAVVDTSAGEMPVLLNGRGHPLFYPKPIQYVPEIPQYPNEFPDVPPADAVSWGQIEDMARNCMHLNCPQCGGTGSRKDGLGSCVHMIACPCPLHSVRCSY